MTLPYDIARCNGANHQLCQACRRREPGHPERQWQVAPAIDGDLCLHFIPPVGKDKKT